MQIRADVQNAGGPIGALRFLQRESRAIGVKPLASRILRNLSKPAKVGPNKTGLEYRTYFQDPRCSGSTATSNFRPAIHFVLASDSSVISENTKSIFETTLLEALPQIKVTVAFIEGDSKRWNLFELMPKALQSTPLQAEFVHLIHVENKLLQSINIRELESSGLILNIGALMDISEKISDNGLMIWSEGGELAYHPLQLELETEWNSLDNQERIETSVFSKLMSFARTIDPKGIYGTRGQWQEITNRHIELTTQRQFSNSLSGDLLSRLTFIEALHESQVIIWKFINPNGLGPSYQYEERQFQENYERQAEVRAFAYYLPQFHPTVENDQWYGKGFTEWTSVRSASPYWRNHYQQHLPHPDIGFYDLSNGDFLRTQAELASSAGLEGLVFYHYWFSGKLVLDKPAKALLSDPSIPLKFFFCWANENWTKRWDGNDSEVLLEQVYSENDAKEFLSYLQPFFADDRYVKIDGRPVLMIYRPNLLPEDGSYFLYWRNVCIELGVPMPYFIASLTRNVEPDHVTGYDALTQRVLHDWTNGQVPNANADLKVSGDFQGDVLDYSKVASHYMNTFKPGERQILPSIVPSWDNTARYHEKSLALSNSTPKVFQKWLEHTLNQIRESIPDSERRLIFINAWNEWAEGAHLEPDIKYGYAHLNALNRAVTGSAVPTSSFSSQPKGETIVILVTMTQTVRDFYREFPDLFEELKANIEASKYGKTPLEFYWRDTVKADKKPFNYELLIQKPAIFPDHTIAEMVLLADRTNNNVISNSYGESAAHLHEDERVSNHRQAHLRLLHANDLPTRLTSIASAAWSFKRLSDDPKRPVEKVTTVIRFHRNSSFEQLERALFSLIAMRNCEVEPMICCQDLTSREKQAMENLLIKLRANYGLNCQVQEFSSLEGEVDLRSLMLNFGFENSQNHYVAFLDFDDLLFPHAYDWLIQRLKISGKNAAFGRIYKTHYSSHARHILRRDETFGVGLSYRDFLETNIFPIHALMFDKRKYSQSPKYWTEHRYMEDYLLTLQLIDEANSDWHGLGYEVYLGDYIHDVDTRQTLALTEKSQVLEVMSDPHYKECQNRVDNLRRSISRDLRSQPT